MPAHHTKKKDPAANQNCIFCTYSMPVHHIKKKYPAEMQLGNNLSA